LDVAIRWERRGRAGGTPGRAGGVRGAMMSSGVAGMGAEGHSEGSVEATEDMVRKGSRGALQRGLGARAAGSGCGKHDGVTCATPLSIRLAPLYFFCRSKK